tara:strand:+ start:193 stop:354 length:162 start_codon:yes stop_codon:yes gene_type:complete
MKIEDIPSWGKKINQLKKRIVRAETNGNYEKVGFRKMRIKKIKNMINELMKKK